MTDPSSQPRDRLPAATQFPIPDRLGRELPDTVRAELAKLPPDRQAAFAANFEKRSKSLLMAYACSLIYCHYILLGRWTMSGFMLLSLFSAAALGSIWWLIDLVRMPRLVRDHNSRVALLALREVQTVADPPGQLAPS